MQDVLYPGPAQGNVPRESLLAKEAANLARVYAELRHRLTERARVRTACDAIRHVVSWPEPNRKLFVRQEGRKDAASCRVEVCAIRAVGGVLPRTASAGIDSAVASSKTALLGQLSRKSRAPAASLTLLRSQSR